MDMEEFVEDRVHVDSGEVETKVKRRREIAGKEIHVEL
jgi:hypothetical protein